MAELQLGWCKLCSDRGRLYGLTVYRLDKRRRCNNQYTKPDRTSVTLCAGFAAVLQGEHAVVIEAAFRLGGLPAAYDLWDALDCPRLGD